MDPKFSLILWHVHDIIITVLVNVFSSYYWYCLRYNKTNSHWRYRWLLKIISPRLEIFPSSFGLREYFHLWGNNLKAIVTSTSVTICILSHRRRNMLRVCSGGGSTLLHEMTSWLPSWKHYNKLKIWLRESMRLYAKINRAKFILIRPKVTEP